jgi:hypothetical protein
MNSVTMLIVVIVMLSTLPPSIAVPPGLSVEHNVTVADKQLSRGRVIGAGWSARMLTAMVIVGAATKRKKELPRRV